MFNQENDIKQHRLQEKRAACQNHARRLWWQVDNKMGWHRFLSPGVFSTAFSWEFPCTSFVGKLPSKNGSRPLGGLVKILVLCYEVCCLRQMAVCEQFILCCIKESGNNSHTSKVAHGWHIPVILHSRHRETGNESKGEIGPQSHPRWQTAWILTEIIWYIMNISYSDWYPLYLQTNFIHQLKPPHHH